MSRKGRSLLLPIHPEHPEPHRVQQAVQLLRDGEVIGYPTDTLYGLAADPSSVSAIGRLYTIRKLDPKKPLALVCASLSQISRYAVFDDACFRFMKRVLPGPYTFVLRATRDVPRMGQTKRRTVGVRIPQAPAATALVSTLGYPFLSTSATEAGAGPSDPWAVAEAYGGRSVPLVLDAGILPGTPSTVVDWSGDEPTVVREGAGPLFELA